jgi:pilus assembly protein Flp/PilA
MTVLRRLATDDSGASAIEYALLAAAIAAVIVLLVVALGGKVSGLFSTANSAIP